MSACRVLMAPEKTKQEGTKCMKKLIVIMMFILSVTTQLVAQVSVPTGLYPDKGGVNTKSSPFDLLKNLKLKSEDSIFVLEVTPWNTVPCQNVVLEPIHCDTVRHIENETCAPSVLKYRWLIFPLVLLLIPMLFVAYKLRGRNKIFHAQHHKDKNPPLKTTEQINEMIDKLSQKGGGSVAYKNRNHEVTIVDYKNKDGHS